MSERDKRYKDKSVVWHFLDSKMKFKYNVKIINCIDIGICCNDIERKGSREIQEGCELREEKKETHSHLSEVHDSEQAVKCKSQIFGQI